METKKCSSSLHQGDRIISTDEFSSKSRICRVCVNTSHRNRRLTGKTNHKRNSKKYYEEHKESYAVRKSKSLLTPRGCAVKLLSQARCRARTENLEFNLELEDITIPIKCPVLGIDLILGAAYTQKEYSPSLDRIDSNRGYTRDNIVVISWRANKIKGNATPMELKALYEFYNARTKI